MAKTVKATGNAGCFRPGCSGIPKAHSWVMSGDYTRWYIECSKCGLRNDTRAYGDESAAWTDWNRRDGDTVTASIAMLAGLIKQSEQEIRRQVVKDIIVYLNKTAGGENV